MKLGTNDLTELALKIRLINGELKKSKTNAKERYNWSRIDAHCSDNMLVELEKLNEEDELHSNKYFLLLDYVP